EADVEDDDVGLLGQGKPDHVSRGGGLAEDLILAAHLQVFSQETPQGGVVRHNCTFEGESRSLHTDHNLLLLIALVRAAFATPQAPLPAGSRRKMDWVGGNATLGPESGFFGGRLGRAALRKHVPTAAPAESLWAAARIFLPAASVWAD